MRALAVIPPSSRLLGGIAAQAARATEVALPPQTAQSNTFLVLGFLPPPPPPAPYHGGLSSGVRAGGAAWNEHAETVAGAFATMQFAEVSDTVAPPVPHGKRSNIVRRMRRHSV